jgi:hypothetical protein
LFDWLIEIEKDFAPPSKKLKGPSFGKGHSTDPFPKGTNPKSYFN